MGTATVQMQSHGVTGKYQALVSTLQKYLVTDKSVPLEHPHKVFYMTPKSGCKFSGQARILLVGVGGLGLWAIEFAKVIYGDKVLVCVADVFVSEHFLCLRLPCHIQTINGKYKYHKTIFSCNTCLLSPLLVKWSQLYKIPFTFIILLLPLCHRNSTHRGARWCSG